MANPYSDEAAETGKERKRNKRGRQKRNKRRERERDTAKESTQHIIDRPLDERKKNTREREREEIISNGRGEKRE